MKDVVKVISGGYFSVFIKRDGSYYGVGDSGSGQLGFGMVDQLILNPIPFPSIPSGIAVCKAGFYHTVFLSNDGHVYMCGAASCGVVGERDANYIRAIIDTRVTNIAAGNHFTAFYTVNLELFVAGDCQCHSFETFTKIIWETPVPLQEMSAGAHHLIMVGKQNDLYGYG